MSIDQELTEIRGWDSLEFDDEAIKTLQGEQLEKAMAEASKYHQVFKQNSLGKQVLEDMIRVTILRPTIYPNDSQFQAGIREGRCDIVRQILQQIEIAERKDA